jgi:bifunctional non-homologous end joining protein LigD
MGLEGVVSKRLDAPYRSGRGGAWLKTKCRGGQEVVIGGWTSTGGSAFRSLLIGVWRERRLGSVGRVGTGFGVEKVKQILPKLRAHKTKVSPFDAPVRPRKGETIQWVKPELAAEIAFAGWTADGQVRQASFKGLREDKPTREIGREEPMAASADKAGDGGAVVLGVTLSNPGKIFWPAASGTRAVSKLDLARYYESVAEWLTPYVKGRPCSIVRTPDGVEGERFYQRHAGAGTSALITLVKVEGDEKPFLQFDTPEAIIAAAQAGVTEFHPWGSTVGDPETPGRLVFDLDPDEALPFERVTTAALEVRDRLAKLGLASFLKTTGGKGLHVVTPISHSPKAKIGWLEAKAFARALCAEMASDSPDAYTTNMAKAKRAKKVFLDYLRNDRTASAVASLSPRAREGAPVSMPLAWRAAKPGLDPSAFTIETSAALMRKHDPWADWEKAGAPLAPAMAKLGGRGR